MGMQNNESTENWLGQIFYLHCWIKDIDKNVLLWWPLTICTCTCVTIYTLWNLMRHLLASAYGSHICSKCYAGSLLGGLQVTMLQLHMGWFPDNFFFICLVCQFAWKKNINLICGRFGCTWGHKFYMNTQNGSKLEIWWNRFFIHVFELKLRHIKVFPSDSPFWALTLLICVIP